MPKKITFWIARDGGLSKWQTYWISAGKFKFSRRKQASAGKTDDGFYRIVVLSDIVPMLLGVELKPGTQKQFKISDV